jgi:hypothetical protein
MRPVLLLIPVEFCLFIYWFTFPCKYHFGQVKLERIIELQLEEAWRWDSSKLHIIALEPKASNNCPITTLHLALILLTRSKESTDLGVRSESYRCGNVRFLKLFRAGRGD